VAFTVLAALVSIIFVLDDTKYPYEMWRMLAFQYLLRGQDIAGSVLAIALVGGAWLLRGRTPALDPVAFLGRNPWAVAMATFIGLCAAMFAAVHAHPLAGDEHLALFQSRVYAAGRLTGQFPPELVYRLIPTWYMNHWLLASESGGVVSIYWPGFSLLLVPFDLLGAPWACNPLLASMSVVLIGKLAARLTSEPRAAGWAMLFAIASPGFLGMALSYFSMSAHLFFNLLFAWLLLEQSPRRLVAAGVVGSFALVLSNPVPHVLFALPWLYWTARRPGGRRRLMALLAGYAPLALILGLGWWLFLRQFQGNIAALPYGPDGDLLQRLGNRLWYLMLELRNVFDLPSEDTLAKRSGEQVRLWSWAVPGLPLLALAGWWLLGRRVAGLHLFALSLASTLLGYLFVSFDQGYGWGARYVHPAWGALPILAAAAMVSIQPGVEGDRLKNYVVRLALFSLVFATALRLFQIRLFMDDQLALRPPFENGARQIVFVAPHPDFYTQDFVQNDPFLRAPVIFMMSRKQGRDYKEVIERRFPGARLTYDGPNGQVWRLE
ncbi:MAG TPA: hypothetical protein VIV54_19795, partial [Burkholderiales bacterium]